MIIDSLKSNQNFLNTKQQLVEQTEMLGWDHLISIGWINTNDNCPVVCSSTYIWGISSPEYWVKEGGLKQSPQICFFLYI